MACLVEPGQSIDPSLLYFTVGVGIAGRIAPKRDADFAGRVVTPYVPLACSPRYHVR